MDFKTEIEKRIKNLNNFKKEEENILKASEIVKNAIVNENKILFCANGGSAADSSHLACEFVVKFKNIRKSYPAISLCSDNSIITAISNDFSFEEIFKRQIESLGKKGDVLIAISTSAKSKNVLSALKEAKKQGLKTIFLTGQNKNNVEADCIIQAPSDKTSEIQEMHLMMGHFICEYVESILES